MKKSSGGKKFISMCVSVAIFLSSISVGVTAFAADYSAPGQATGGYNNGDTCIVNGVKYELTDILYTNIDPPSAGWSAVDKSGFKYTVDDSGVTITGFDLPFYGIEYNGHYYGLSLKSDTWLNAKSECESNGGHLVYIENEAEQRAIESVFKFSNADSRWIGACLENDNWQWDNGELMEYANWNNGIPGRGKYAQISGTNYLWDGNIVSDTYSQKYICEWDDRPSDNVFFECTSALIIPKEIDGLPVKNISAGAFSNKTYISSIIIPEGITEIKENTFSGCTGLTEVNLPETLKTINRYAFYNCTSLENIEIPDSVTSISSYTFDGCKKLSSVKLPLGWTDVFSQSYGTISPFYNCESLKRIELPEGMTTLPAYAFRYASSIETVVLPESLQTIGQEAFYGCTGLKNIEFNQGLKTIGQSAFSGCTGLTSINLPDSLEPLGNGAFSNCSSLESIDLPDSWETIGFSAFSGCTSLKNVKLPESLKTLSTALSGCTSLESVELPAGLETIESSAFSGCTGLKSITIPEGITEIKESTFSGCTGLTEVNLPETLKTINRYAFYNCTSLENIEIPDSVTSISSYTFDGCKKLSSVKLPLGWTDVFSQSYGTISPFYNCESLKRIELPEGMTTLPAYAFRYASSIETVVLPESLQTIGQEAFYGCTGLKNIEFNQGLKTIGQSAFSGCTGLTSINLPDSLEPLGNGAFSNCSSLESIDLPDSWETIGFSAFSGCTSLKNVKLPESLKTLSTALSGCTSLESVELPAGLETIESSAFSGCTGLKSITIPEGITEIKESTFSGCTGLTEVNLPETLKTINRYAFYNCTSLENIEIPDSVTSISSYTFDGCKKLSSVKLPLGWTDVFSQSYGTISPFYNCESLKRIELPEGMTTLPAYAFRYASSIETVVLPESLQTIGQEAFYGCTGLKNIEFNQGLKTIGQSAFSGCTGLTSINLPDSLEPLGNGAFSNCSSLESIDLPDSWETIGFSAFSGCTSLKNVKLPESLKTLSTALSGCTSLESVELPAGLETIESSAFSGCTGLKSITIPEGITEIKESTFSGCTGLTEVNLPETLKTINRYAFYNCTSLENIEIPDSVTSISSYTFDGCKKLSSVKLPLGWTDVFSQSYGTISPFYNCESLKRIELPEGMTTLPAYAFRYASSIETVVLPESLQTIGQEAFYGCTGLKNIEFNQGLKTIGQSAFSGCTGLTSINLPDSLEPLGNGAFSNCSSLESIDLPDSWETIGFSAFSGCTSLKNVKLPESLKTLSTALSGCTSLESVELPAGLETIESSAFSGCTGLKSITIPEGITEIKESTFSGCTGLTEVNLPETLKTINRYAFYNCTSLENIEIPDSVTSISSYTFDGCKKLSSVKLPLGWTDVFSQSYGTISPFYNCESLKRIELPEGMTTLPAYAFRYASSIETVVLPESLQTIGQEAFYGCTGLKNIEFNQGLKTIGQSAFSGCTGLTSINLPDSLETVTNSTFYNCTNIVSLVLNENLKEISDYSFGNCSNLMTVRIPESVTSFGTNSFYNCPQLTIYCYSGSAAHYVAENNSNKYYLLDEHEHSYSIEKTPATCTQNGFEIYTCTICGYHYIKNLLPLGHDYNEWQTQSEPTCTTEGIKFRVCKRCNYEDIAIIPMENHDCDKKIIESTCTEKGYSEYTCKVCGYTYKSDYTEAKGHFYEDWIIDKNATILEEGSKHRVCSVCQYTENCKIQKITVDIDTNKNYGIANFTIVNAQSLEPIKDAKVFISTEKDGENTFFTDENGQVSIVLPVGMNAISVYANGCITRNIKINISSGEQNIPSIGLSDKPTYDTELKSHLMTIEEIEAAGIDTTSPSNQHVYRYELTLSYEPEIDWLSLLYYVNADGLIIPGESFVTNPPCIGGSTPPGTEKPTESRKVIWVNDNNTAIPGGGGHFHVPGANGESDVEVYPVSENFYLIVRGDIRWLKEMFDVEMLIINNSMTDTLENLTATISLSEGLSLATMIDEQQTLSQHIDFIGQGQSEVLHWYVRGDKAGSYDLSAKLQGTVMPFEEEINESYVVENQIQVWAGNALHLDFAFPNAAYYGEDYPITVTLTNVSDITLYNISHIIQAEQGMEIYYSNGKEKKKIDKDSWVSSGLVREFNPGDAIIIESSINIFFESEIMERKIKKLIKNVDDMQRLLSAYKTVNTAAKLLDTLINCISGCSKALDEFDASAANISQGKIKLFNKLHTEISSLMEECTTTGNENIDAAIALTNSGIDTTLNAIASDPEEWLKETDIKDINKLLTKVTALKEKLSTDKSQTKKFNIFDSIRTAISAIPIRFVLKDVVMFEDENSTTIIPWSYSTSQAGPQYFGVSNVSKHIMSIIQAEMSEIYNNEKPLYANLIPGMDDPFSYDEAVGYIQATEKEIALFKAKDSTGDVKFKVWVEENNPQSTDLKTRQIEKSFLLSCDNETAIYEDEILTFTGDGMISIIPQTLSGGTLNIEDSNGGHYTYVINVVAQHECVASDWNILINPTDEYDGTAIKYCEICGEMMDIKNLPHDKYCAEHMFEEWTTETEATCMKSGIQSHTCTVCGAIEYHFSDPKEHTCNEWDVVKEATCAHEGEEKSICSICGEEVIRIIEKMPHNAGEWVILKEASAFEEGIKELHCSDCDSFIKRDIIPMTEESFGYSKDAVDKFIVGLPECVTPEMLIAHYKNMGLSITVTDVDGKSVEYVGTGCKVFFDSVEYTVILNGDATGDGMIDVFDFLKILDHVNGKELLQDIYKKAGLIVNDEEIDIFDALKVLDHINGNEDISA